MASACSQDHRILDQLNACSEQGLLGPGNQPVIDERRSAVEQAIQYSNTTNQPLADRSFLPFWTLLCPAACNVLGDGGVILTQGSP
jgi:hypothetical protein